MRAVPALLIVVAWWVAAYAGFERALDLPAWGPLLAVVVGAGMAPFVGAAFITRRPGMVKAGLGGFGCIALLALLKAFAAWTSQRSEGTPETVAMLWLSVCALAAPTLAALVSALPGDRRALIAAATVLAVGGLAACGAAAAVPDACSRFELTREHWRADRESVAEAIVRCRSLEGLDRASVRRVLGGERKQNSWRLQGGWFTTRRLHVSFYLGRAHSVRIVEGSFD